MPRTNLKMFYLTEAAMGLWLLAGPSASAQDASLSRVPQQQGPSLNMRQEPPLTLQNGSYIYDDLPPESQARELEVRDIITVLVDYRTRMLSEGDAEARKTSNLVMRLADWLRFDGKSIKAAPQRDGDLAISGFYNSQYRAQSDVELRDNLTFKIAAEIMEIRPNGNLYIEGHLKQGGKLGQITRHMLGLFSGRPGARMWRRILSEGAHKPGAGPELVEAALAAVQAASSAMRPTG
ncbi:MAG: flagellar basal body L-ring protein FlgH [Planctomycetota bacterium]